MNRIVFLLEEDSMRILLEGLLPRLFPELSFQCVPHEGKQDLEKSIPRKLKAWREPGVRFVVVRDQDSADCHQVKTNLVQLCQSTGRRDVLVRVACRELEAWYIGEPQALKQAFPATRPSALRELGKTSIPKPRYCGSAFRYYCQTDPRVSETIRCETHGCFPVTREYLEQLSGLR